MKAALVLTVGVGLFAIALWVLPRDDVARTTSARTTAPRAETPPDRTELASKTSEIGALVVGDDGPATQDAAAALRRLLRSDPAARDVAEERLLAAHTSRELRMALALVLGTLPGSDPILRQALARFREDTEVARCLIFALGATREPLDDDEVFGLGGRPWGVHGPKGLGITVRRAIEDGETRAVLAACLGDERGAVREAAAIALRHSMRTVQVRSDFVAALRMESNDDVALVLGEALAVWAGGGARGGEQAEVVDALLARAGDVGFEGFRFRMEDDFRRVVLNPAQEATLAEYSQPARPYSVRSFALTVLAATSPEEARGLLEGYVTGDRDVAVRDLSARLLGRLPRDAGTIVALVAACRDDAAWNVRYQAVVALARFPSEEAAVAALKAATADPDARVAKRAREALGN